MTLNRNLKSFTLIEPFDKLRASSRQSFTLIELLVVLALVAILSVVVVMTLNPAELLKQARDSNRLSDLATINTALNLFSTDVIGGFMGTSTVVYVSLPSTTSTCSNLGLPTLPSGYTYNCVTSQNLRNTDGTGWIPVNFNRISSNSPISQLPIDPTNTTSTRLYYTYVSGGSWELSASIEASKNKLGGSNDLVSKDGGSAASVYEIGNNLNLNPIETGDPSLVGYWNFEEATGTTVYDRSGSGYNLSIASGSRLSGRGGSVFSLADIGARVNGVGNKTFNINSQSYTYCSLVNMPVMVLNTYPTVIIAVNFARSGLVAQGNAASGVRFYSYAAGGADPTGASFYPYGVWHHVCVTYTAGVTTRKIYVNGAYNYSDSSGSLVSEVGPVILGNGGINCCGLTTISPVFLDEERMYSRELVASEIKALYDVIQ